MTAGGDASTDAGKLDQIEYGWTFSDDWTRETPDEVITDLFYLLGVPWAALYEREIADFSREGEYETVFYSPLESNTFVLVNRARSWYQVVVDGREIAREFATFAPLWDGRLAVYSRAGGQVRIPAKSLPNGGRVVDVDGKPGPGLERAEDAWGVHVDARTPYFVVPA